MKQWSITFITLLFFIFMGATVSLAIEKKTNEVLAASNLSQDAYTQEEPAITQRVPWHGRLPLAAFAKEHIERFIELRQSEASYPLEIPLPHRIAVESVKLHVVFTNSNALLRSRSQIRFRWNGGVVGQSGLDPEFPDGETNISVALDNVRGGNNQLLLEVSQHYMAECEDPGSPELWTTIDMQASYIQVIGFLKPVPDRLTELGHWLSPATWGNQRITLAALGNSQSHLHAGTMLAQGLGAKTNNTLIIDALPHLRSLHALPKGQDAVVFGLYDEAMKIPGLLAKKPTSRGHIVLLPQRNNEGYFLLLVLADSIEHLTDVAGVLSWASLPLQETASMDIQKVTPPPATPYAANQATMAGRSYTFSALGYQSQTLHGLHDHAVVNMWLPPDLFSKNHTTIDILLHFSYGAALRPDSVMNIYHNGIFLQSMSLGNPQGLQVTDYRISIPMLAFRPGLNEFKFEARMHANTGSNCTTGNTDNLLMTLYDDSRIIIPDAPHFVAMPNVYYTLNTGFPYLGSNDANPAIQIKGITKDDVSAAWTLAAKIGQLKGAPVKGLHITTKASTRNDVIRLAKLKDIKPELWQHAPVDLSEKGVVNHPVLTDPQALGEKNTSLIQQLFKLLWWDDREQRQAAKYYKASIQHSSQILKNSGILMQMENPHHEDGTLTLILADGDKEMRQAIEDLVELWPQLHNAKGDTLFWGRRGTDQQLDYNVLRLNQYEYHIGAISWWQRMTYFAIHNPIFLLSSMLVFLLLLTWLTRWVLIRHRRYTNPDIA